MKKRFDYRIAFSAFWVVVALTLFIILLGVGLFDVAMSILSWLTYSFIPKTSILALVQTDLGKHIVAWFSILVGLVTSLMLGKVDQDRIKKRD